MARGVFTTMATAIALALGVNASAYDGQHGHSAAPEHPAHANSGGNTSNAKASSAPATKSASAAAQTGTTPLSPVQQKVSTHAQLASRLQSRLGTGTNVVAAASGFRTLGQFVSTVNVAHNLGIPFSQLKTDVVTNHMSLGQAIQALRPATSATTARHEVERAETEAKADADADAKSAAAKGASTKRSSGEK